MVNCGACGNFLSLSGAAVCSICPIKYHRACLAITDKTQLAKDWICLNCKRQMRKGDNSQTPVKNLCEDSGLEEPAQLSSSAGPAGASAAAASSARSPVLTEFRREFAECIDEMREFRKEMALLRESFAAFTLRLDGVERRLEVLERGQSQGDAARVAQLELSISALRQQLNDRDQDALLSDIEVGHLLEEKGENTVHEVMVLAGRLGVPLEARDVVFAERVGARPAEVAGRVRRVVVRLASRHLRDELMMNAMMSYKEMPYQRPQKAGKRQLFESDEEGSNKQSDQRPRKLTKKVVRDTKAVYDSDDEESNKTLTPQRGAARPRPAAAGWNLNLGDEAEEIEASRARKPAVRADAPRGRRVPAPHRQAVGRPVC
ncbi:hypothetical protein ACJJTC_012275 [Scirpophaga incertulas]